MPSAAATTSRSIRPRRDSSVAGRPSRACASVEQLVGGLFGDRLAAARGVAGAGGCRPSSPRRAARATVSGSVLATCSSVISASPGRNCGGLGDRGLPGVLDDPDERAHVGSDLESEP